MVEACYLKKEFLKKKKIVQRENPVPTSRADMAGAERPAEGIVLAYRSSRRLGPSGVRQFSEYPRIAFSFPFFLVRFSMNFSAS